MPWKPQPPVRDISFLNQKLTKMSAQWETEPHRQQLKSIITSNNVEIHTLISVGPGSPFTCEDTDCDMTMMQLVCFLDIEDMLNADPKRHATSTTKVKYAQGKVT